MQAMIDNTSILQEGFRTIGLASSALTTLLGGNRFYDQVPQNSPFPYVQFGPIYSAPFRTHSGPGQDTIVQLDVWSEYQGNKQVNDIINILHGLFGDQNITLPVYGLVFSYYEYSDVFQSTDGRLRHGICRYRVPALQRS